MPADVPGDPDPQWALTIDTRAQFNEYIAELTPISREQFENLIPLFEPLMPLHLDRRISEYFLNTPHDIWARIDGHDTYTGITMREEDIDSLIEAIGNLYDIPTGHNPAAGETPILESRLPDGSRIEGILKGAAVDAPYLGVRKHAGSMLTPEDLVRAGSLTEDARDWIYEHIDAGCTSLIAGSTDTGKTTYLNALATRLNTRRRILICEDVPELRIEGPQVIRLQLNYREKIGWMTIAKTLMRMTADHIFFGEIRGGDHREPSPAYELTKILNSGHDASATTIHANPGEALTKYLDYMFEGGGENIPISVFKRAIVSAFQIVIQLCKIKTETGARKITESISTVDGVDPDTNEFKLTTVFQFPRDASGRLKTDGSLERVSNKKVRKDA